MLCVWLIIDNLEKIMVLTQFQWSGEFHVVTDERYYTLFHEIFSTFFKNEISLPERRNKRKSGLEITKMYYFKI